MDDITTLNQQSAEIEAGTRTFFAETFRLPAERAKRDGEEEKFLAESGKLRRETAWYPFAISLATFAAGSTFTVALAALLHRN